ncbi:MAG: D-alanine--D-alanine ligase [Candidatus Riflebacteria bacterium]|nr:D-alanine--D-alanine ligase [Candidatus Riflebacteria bacterium]
MRLALACNRSDRYRLADHRPDDLYEEFDAPETIDAIAEAIAAHGHTVDPIEADRTFPAVLERGKYDFVFNIAEGLTGRCRESQVPAVCEMLGVSYSGSDAITLGITLDKDLAKRVLKGRVRTAAGRLFIHPDRIDLSGMPFPLLAKPNAEGSSKGIRNRSRLTDPITAPSDIAEMIRMYEGPVLVEEFLPGVECTVGVLGNEHPEILGIMEIAPRHTPLGEFVYSLEAKRDYKNQIDYHSPPRFSENTRKAVEQVATEAFIALGCRDFARIDFRFAADGEPCFIEANPLPGLSPIKSDLVLLCRGMDITYHDLIGRILQQAFRRTGLAISGSRVGVS